MSKVIVITGGTRGIGLALAEAFLSKEHSVVFCGRTATSVAQAEAVLSKRHTTDRILGVVADVSNLEQVQNLWDKAVQKHGDVDIWINNAGLNAKNGSFWERSQGEVGQVVSTNIVGLMNGCTVAVGAMVAQGHGSVYNMEGMGSRGPVVAGTALYASTKAAVTKFTEILVKDTAATPVTVGFLSPGMVTTELLMGDGGVSAPSGFLKIVNILADHAETVAPYLADRILRNSTHGAHIQWLTGPKIAWRFMTAMFRKNRLYNEHGVRR